MKQLFLGASAALIVGACTQTEPELIVPQDVIYRGDPVSIAVTGLEPDQTITLTTYRAFGKENPRVYFSRLQVNTGDDRIADTGADQVTIAGEGLGVNPAAPFWSMTLLEENSPSELSDGDVLVLADIDNDAATDLEASFKLLGTPEDMIEAPLGEAFPGAFVQYVPSDTPQPVIIVLGGSEGGDRGSRGLTYKLAARGYVAVGMPYYSPAWGDQPQQFPGLPRAFANIELSYIGEVADAARALDFTNPDSMCLYGVSKGAEYVLAAASRIDGFDCVAAIVPSDVIWEGWGAGETVSSFAWQSEPLDFVPYKGMAEEFQKPEPSLRIPHDAGREAFPGRVAPARIAAEQIDEPVFVVGGDADKVWNSGLMARNIKQTRDAAGLETEIYVSEEAGHSLSGDGYSPGTAPEDAQLQSEAFPALMAFFDRNMKSSGK